MSQRLLTQPESQALISEQTLEIASAMCLNVKTAEAGAIGNYLAREAVRLTQEHPNPSFAATMALFVALSALRDEVADVLGEDGLARFHLMAERALISMRELMPDAINRIREQPIQ
jgi:hypothetical protein